MDFDAISQAVVAFMQANQRWAPIIVFLIAFAECVAILSWLVPATFFFTALGTVAGASGLNLFPLGLSASCGAGLGSKSQQCGGRCREGYGQPHCRRERCSGEKDTEKRKTDWAKLQGELTELKAMSQECNASR